MNEFEYILQVEALSKLSTKSSKVKFMRGFRVPTHTYTIWDINLAIYVINNFEGLSGWGRISKALTALLPFVSLEMLQKILPINKPSVFPKIFVNQLMHNQNAPPYLKLEVIKAEKGLLPT